jgi:hypothetical protein
MSCTLMETVGACLNLGDSTAGVDYGAGNGEVAAGYWSRIPVTKEPEDLIRGKEAKFAAAASRRAMKKMMSKPRDDPETR